MVPTHPLSHYNDASHSTTSRWALASCQVVGASFLLALCAHIKIPLPFTPIPLSMQTFAILLIGAFLGGRKGAASVALYLAWGIGGMPVFASGAANFAHLAGPSGGYLLACVVQACLVGRLLQTRASSGGAIFVMLAACCALQLGMGSLWLSHFVGWEDAFVMGFAPFIPGEILKSLAAAALIRRFAVGDAR